MTPQAPAACAACVGRDWAEATHALGLPVAGAPRRELLRRAHRPEVLDAWVCTLRTRCNGPPLAVCLERKKGPMVSALHNDDSLVLCPVHPLTVATDREALTPSRATDDPTEAARQVERLLTPRDTLTPLVPHRPPMRAWAPLVAHRRRLVGDTVRRTQRLTRARTHSFPHVLQGLQDKETALLCDFLRRWPTLQAVHRARRATLERFFPAHHVRSADVITTRLAAITHAVALTTDDGVIAPHTLLVPALVAPLRVTLHALTACDPAMALRAHAHPDFPVCDAWPGAGAVLAPRLLVAFGAPRARVPAAEARHKYAGSAPVTARRGTPAWVHWRWQCPTCLRHTCVAWAAASIRHAFWAHVSDQQPRDQGTAHQAARRAWAFKWSRILYRCGQERTPSDASTSLQALTRRGSSLIHHLAQAS